MTLTHQRFNVNVGLAMTLTHQRFNVNVGLAMTLTHQRFNVNVGLAMSTMMTQTTWRILVATWMQVLWRKLPCVLTMRFANDGSNMHWTMHIVMCHWQTQSTVFLVQLRWKPCMHFAKAWLRWSHFLYWIMSPKSKKQLKTDWQFGFTSRIVSRIARPTLLRILAME